jgi:hypothetical protein
MRQVRILTFETRELIRYFVWHPETFLDSFLFWVRIAVRTHKRVNVQMITWWFAIPASFALARFRGAVAGCFVGSWGVFTP